MTDSYSLAFAAFALGFSLGVLLSVVRRPSWPSPSVRYPPLLTKTWHEFLQATAPAGGSSSSRRQEPPQAQEQRRCPPGPPVPPPPPKRGS